MEGKKKMNGILLLRKGILLLRKGILTSNQTVE